MSRPQSIPLANSEGKPSIPKPIPISLPWRGVVAQEGCLGGSLGWHAARAHSGGQQGLPLPALSASHWPPHSQRAPQPQHTLAGCMRSLPCCPLPRPLPVLGSPAQLPRALVLHALPWQGVGAGATSPGKEQTSLAGCSAPHPPSWPSALAGGHSVGFGFCVASKPLDTVVFGWRGVNRSSQQKHHMGTTNSSHSTHNCI